MSIIKSLHFDCSKKYSIFLEIFVAIEIILLKCLKEGNTERDSCIISVVGEIFSYIFHLRFIL